MGGHPIGAHRILVFDDTDVDQPDLLGRMNTTLHLKMAPYPHLSYESWRFQRTKHSIPIESCESFCCNTFPLFDGE